MEHRTRLAFRDLSRPALLPASVAAAEAAGAVPKWRTCWVPAAGANVWAGTPGERSACETRRAMPLAAFRRGGSDSDSGGISAKLNRMPPSSAAFRSSRRLRSVTHHALVPRHRSDLFALLKETKRGDQGWHEHRYRYPEPRNRIGHPMDHQCDNRSRDQALHPPRDRDVRNARGSAPADQALRKSP